jgi:Calcineurin-like phosphoesterase
MRRCGTAAIPLAALVLYASCSKSPTDSGPPVSFESGTPGVDAGAALTASFVTLGCNRIQNGDWVQSSDPSSANTGQLQQDFTDVAALSVTPRYFFFTGDLVLGLTSTLPTLVGQLEAWTPLWNAAPIVKTVPLVPLPGNHEMLEKSGGNEVPNDGAGVSADAAWTSWLTSSGFASRAGNGPTPASSPQDDLEDDQSQLTYSFDDGPVHYVTLNTDTWTSAQGGGQIGWVAESWLEADLAKAQASSATTAIFVFGHKPLVSPVGSTSSSDIINPALTVAVENALNGASKVKGYFCAHYHAWDARTLPGSRGVYQVIAGNGGSALDSSWTPPTVYYGFTEVHLYASGKVGVISHARPVPSPYNATTGIQPAVAQTELIISE